MCYDFLFSHVDCMTYEMLKMGGDLLKINENVLLHVLLQ